MIAPTEEWQQLDAWTRRAVLRNARELWPYPDPSVGAVAARYARSYLDAPRRARERWLALIAPVVVVVLTTVTAAWVSSGPVPGRANTSELVLIWASGIVATAAAFVPFVIYQDRITRFSRVEMAHQLALERSLAAGAGWVLPPAVREQMARSGFAARYEPRRVWREIARMPLPLYPLIMSWLTWRRLGPDADRAFLVVNGVLTATAIALLVFRVAALLRVMLSSRPLVALDSGGVHLPDLACTLPWAEVAEVRLFRQRGGYQRSGQPVVIVAFVPRDPASVLSSLRVTGLRRWRVERALRKRGTPLTVADQLADRSGLEIAAAVRAFAAVPVHWYC